MLHSSSVFRFAVSKNAQRLADYHGEGSPANVMQLVEGRSLWMGLGSEMLGISNTPCTRSQMLAVSSGKDPATERQLTPASGQRSDRRVAWDCVFAAPKQISLLALLAGDGRVLAAHTRAVHASLLYMESMACANAPDLARVLRPFTPTSNVVAGHLLHTHSRRSQPHLHSHLVIFNLTFEQEQRRWLALQAKPIFKHVPVIQRIYHSELAHQMRHAGYDLADSRSKILLPTFPQELVALFSSNDEIRAEALERYNSTKLGALKWANDSSRPATKAQPEALELDADRWRNSVADPKLIDRLYACVPPYPEAPAAPPDLGDQIAEAQAITKQITVEQFSRNLFLRPDAILRESLARSFGQISPVAVFRSVQQFFTDQRTRMKARMKSSRMLSHARAIITGTPEPRLFHNLPIDRHEALLNAPQVAKVAINSRTAHGRLRTTSLTDSATRSGVAPAVARLDGDIAFSIIASERSKPASRPGGVPGPGTPAEGLDEAQGTRRVQ